MLKGGLWKRGRGACLEFAAESKNSGESDMSVRVQRRWHIETPFWNKRRGLLAAAAPQNAFHRVAGGGYRGDTF